MAPIVGTDAAIMGIPKSPDVVEVNLLLPANRVEALVALSRKRRQSVGQILRQWIDRALADDE